MMGKWIKLWFPGAQEAKPLRDGKVILLTKKTLANKEIMCADKFSELCNIKVAAMDTMNRVQGSIYGREILSVELNELKRHLADKGVVNISQCKTTVPASSDQVHQVRDDTALHQALRCGECCLFGHSKGLCIDCAETRHEEHTPHLRDV